MWNSTKINKKVSQRMSSLNSTSGTGLKNYLSQRTFLQEGKQKSLFTKRADTMMKTNEQESRTQKFEISFRQPNHKQVEALHSATIWKRNYESLIKYISEYMQNASFLAEKCIQLQNQCRKNKKSILESEHKHNQEQNLTKQNLVLMSERMEETQKSMQDFFLMNEEKQKKIYQMEQIIKNSYQKMQQYEQINKKLNQQIEILTDSIQRYKLYIIEHEKSKEKQILAAQRNISSLENKYFELEKIVQGLNKQNRKLQIEKILEKEQSQTQLEQIICSFQEKIKIQESQYQKRIEQFIIQSQNLNNDFQKSQIFQKIIQEQDLRINQKQWQIEKFEQIKKIEEKKCYDLQIKNNELISDIQSIIQQLKIRELQIESLQKKNQILENKILCFEEKKQNEEKQDSQKLIDLEDLQNINPSFSPFQQKQPKFNLQDFHYRVVLNQFNRFKTNKKIR